TTDMERPHGELGAGFANRLGGDDADRFADVDPVATGEISAVAVGAYAVARLAGDRRAHLDLVDAVLIEHLYPFLVDQGAGRCDDLILARTNDVFGHDA